MRPSKMVTLGLVVLLLWELHVVEGTQSSSIRLDSHLKSVDVGDTVTLHCFYQITMSIHLSWYRQTLGDKPQLVSTMSKFGQQSRLHNKFEDNPRFSVHGGEGINNLRISNVQPSDSAMYFCCESFANKVEFADGVFLNVKGPGSNTNEVVQQPVSDSIQPGDSVTLNCTIPTETCAGEHSVYWFRHGSGESHPGILYSHGGRSDQCEKSPEAGSPTQSCVYNLHKRNLSLSDAGTYYCAVASCGEILFGNGTMLDIESRGEEQMRILVFLSIMRTGVLFCCLFIVIILCFIKKSS
ncbi:T cell receptor alpha chain MC.7.G5-like [Osmerus mordax]|uniref:T cell receptor alpha chain MC.7.G5-like n=1 Tax=Osmerus mordax TaxID=8014 RepID=UPI00350EDC54